MLDVIGWELGAGQEALCGLRRLHQLLIRSIGIGLAGRGQGRHGQRRSRALKVHGCSRRRWS